MGRFVSILKMETREAEVDGKRIRWKVIDFAGE